jgi:phosphoribosylamine--glycine ligase
MMRMKTVLVIGSGGREHALVWKLSQSPKVSKIYAIPGNPGIAQLAECVSLPTDQPELLLRFAQEHAVDLTVVGPEGPLTAGVADVFAAAGRLLFGPTRAASRLESSKAFAKDFFARRHIPTAAYQSFDDSRAARSYAARLIAAEGAAVIKADGLAAGKGVIIARSRTEADEAVDQMMTHRQFGSAGERVVVESFLEGEELSFFAVSDGEFALPFMAAQDHKRVFDGDMGPNTGGMGAYTQPPVYDDALRDQIMRDIIVPTLQGMQAEGCPFAGVLYAGLMLTASGPKILEYNVRWGDPETQVLMPMLRSDAYELFSRAAQGSLRDYRLRIYTGACVAVVLASAGYPGAYTAGEPITGLEALRGETLVFQAGTRWSGQSLVTDGGRVLAVVSRASSVQEAVAAVYDEVTKVHFAGRHFRRDIGRRALRQSG